MQSAIYLITRNLNDVARLMSDAGAYSIIVDERKIEVHIFYLENFNMIPGEVTHEQRSSEEYPLQLVKVINGVRYIHLVG